MRLVQKIYPLAKHCKELLKEEGGVLFENCVISLESMLSSHTVHYRITA